MEGWQADFGPKLNLLSAALAGQTVTQAGLDVQIEPPPQRAPFPIVMACSSFETAKLAAERGIPLILPYVLDPQTKRDLLDHYEHIAVEHGHDPATIEHTDSLVVQVGTSSEAALAVLRTIFVPFQIETARCNQSLVPMPMDQVEGVLHQTLQFAAYGTPEECAATINASLAVTRLKRCLFVVEGAVEPVACLDNITAISTSVLPLLTSGS